MMNKITNYYVLGICAGLLSLLNSCSKGEGVAEPQFGFISIGKFADADIKVIQGEALEFKPDGVVKNTLAGMNRFRFYESDVLQLDTMLMVTPYYNRPYVLFKPNQNTPIHVYDPDFNGFKQEALPDSGFVKISFANFSEKFPGRVDVHLTSNTIIDFKTQEIEIAEFLNTSNSFVAFKPVKLGSTINLTAEHDITVTLKDPDTKVVLMTTKITLPYGAGKGSKNLPYVVYLMYLDGKDVVTILMNK